MNNWFKTFGWFYLPVSAAGFIAFTVFLIFNIQVFIAVDRHSHSVSDTFYGVFPYFICSLVLLFWVASHTSRKK